jgi:hypothetical protein
LFLSSEFYAHVSEPACTLGSGVYPVSIDHRWSSRVVVKRLFLTWEWL